jgi:hypothetical protein
MSRPSKGTTTIGYINRNPQRVIRILVGRAITIKWPMSFSVKFVGANMSATAPTYCTRRVRSCPAASLYVVSAAEWSLAASHRLWSEPAYFVHLNLLSYLKP